MKGLRNISLTLFAFVTSWMLVISYGCSSDECLQNKTALPYAGIYASGDTDNKKISIDSLEIYGYGAPGDSILFNGSSAISNIYLPFRPDHDTTTYIFRYLHSALSAMGIKDTVRFIYTRDPRFVSSACGVSYIYNIKAIQCTGLLIDSVVCPMNAIDNMDTENLRIYFKVSNERD